MTGTMQHRRGLTLIELTVAMAIATVVVVAAMATITALVRVHDLDRRRGRELAAADGLGWALAADLAHARAYRPLADGTGFELRTDARLDGGRMELDHLPTRVVYAIRRQVEGGPGFLVRTQHVDGRKPWAELVGEGISASYVGPAEEEAGEPDRDGWIEAPRRLAVFLESSGGETIRRYEQATR